MFIIQFYSSYICHLKNNNRQNVTPALKIDFDTDLTPNITRHSCMISAELVVSSFINYLVRLSNIVPFHIIYQVNLYWRNNSAHKYNYFETLFHTLAYHTNFCRIFHPCSLVPHFHVSHFPPLQVGAANSCLAFSVAPMIVCWRNDSRARALLIHSHYFTLWQRIQNSSVFTSLTGRIGLPQDISLSVLLFDKKTTHFLQFQSEVAIFVLELLFPRFQLLLLLFHYTTLRFGFHFILENLHVTFLEENWLS